MGRKSSMKNKEKRQQRKEDKMKLSAAKAAVNAANKITDPLEPFPVFRNFCKNGINVTFEAKLSRNMDANLIQWAFDLTKRNMEATYDWCDWGWDDECKREEMTSFDSWYLLAKGDDGNYVGLSHFKFDLDYGVEVLYCYELQLEKHVRRKGLGKFMMQILELIAFKNSMRKVILTILKHNQGSLAFFMALGYKLDETSPDIECDGVTEPYQILSKPNKKLLMQEQEKAALEESHKHSHSHESEKTKIASLLMHPQCCSSHH